MNNTVEAPPVVVRAPIAPTPSANGELRERVQKLRLGGNDGAKKGLLRSVSWLPWVLCAMLAFAWGGIALRTYRNAPTKNEQANSNNAPTSVSATSTKAVEAGSVLLEVKGYLIPAQQIAVSPIDVGGRLIELNFVEGKKYPRGYVLARLDATNYQASLDEAKKSLLAAIQRRDAAKAKWDEQKPESVRPIEIKQIQAEIDESKAIELRARQELDRIGSFKGGGGISPKEFQQAQADLTTSKARTLRLQVTLEILEKGPRPERIAAVHADYDAADAEVAVAEARVRQAEWRVDNCEIRAPIEGTILSKKAEQWNLVNPMAFGGTSGSVCDMADLRDLEVDVEIAERDISKLKLGQPCRIRADAFPERTYDGKLDRIMPIANRSKSIVSVRVKVQLPKGEEPGSYLKPEMGAVVSFLPE